MKKYFALFFLTAVLSHTSLHAQAKDSIDRYLENKMKKNGIPGLQLAVVRRGRIVKSGCFGLANLQDSAVVGRNTIFQVNSITKAFVGVAVLQLVEAGELDLSRPVSAYLDSLPASWQKITIRQLLTHTSGLPNILDNNTGKLVGPTDSAAWANVLAMPVEFAPGEMFRYCQTNYVLIGMIINKISGQDFTAFIKSKQLDIVQMPSTGFFDSYDVVPYAANVYTHNVFIGNTRYRSEEPRNVFYEFAPFIRTTVGLNTTAAEMAKWIIALQQGKLLKNKNSLAELWKPYVLNNSQTAGFSRLFNGYAIGWPAIIRPQHPAVAPIGAGSSAVFVYPQDSLTVIILTNMQGANPEEFADEVAGFYIPDMKAANGFGLPPSVQRFRALLVKRGFNKAVEVLQEITQKMPVIRSLKMM